MFTLDLTGQHGRFFVVEQREERDLSQEIRIARHGCVSVAIM